eukprot:gene15913-10345_t
MFGNTGKAPAWYMGKTSFQEADKMLKLADEVGTFLIRDRDSEGKVPEWYMGSITMEAAKDMIMQEEVGTFLIRDRDSNGNYDLAVNADGRAAFYLIKRGNATKPLSNTTSEAGMAPQKERYALFDDVEFSCMEDLIAHYTEVADSGATFKGMLDGLTMVPTATSYSWIVNALIKAWPGATEMVQVGGTLRDKEVTTDTERSRHGSMSPTMHLGEDVYDEDGDDDYGDIVEAAAPPSPVPSPPRPRRRSPPPILPRP